MREQSIGSLWRVMLLMVVTARPGLAGEPMSVTALAGKTHFHGIAVDRKDPTRLYLATHHGFYAVTPVGMATRLSDNRNDYMGFAPHPTDPAIFYASGHPAGGGNTGVIMSSDGGRTWRQLAKGVNGPVDFHQMDVSAADPQTLYGVFDGLQISRDGGRTWTLKGPVPAALIDLAASATRVDRLYAATKRGLLVSDDAGASWGPAHLRRAPATMVQTTANGDVYAFIVGLGLLRSDELALRWTPLSSAFGDAYVVHLAVDPTDAKNLYVITNKRALAASRDGGRTWRGLDAK